MTTQTIQNIILVDDDPINNLVNKEVLRQYDQTIKVNEFLDASKAIGFLSQNNPMENIIIFLDINMPHINGWEFLQALRNVSVKIPVIILTSSIDDYDMDEAKKYPEIVGFLHKPLSVSKLKNILV